MNNSWRVTVNNGGHFSIMVPKPSGNLNRKFSSVKKNCSCSSEHPYFLQLPCFRVSVEMIAICQWICNTSSSWYSAQVLPTLHICNTYGGWMCEHNVTACSISALSFGWHHINFLIQLCLQLMNSLYSSF